MRDEWKKLDDWQKQRKSQELQYQALQSSPSSNTNTASSSQGTSSNNIVNNQDKTSAIQSSPSSNTNTANSSQGTCSNNTITVNSQDKTSVSYHLLSL
ncbi:putative protein TPRXL [Stylophora pistillata]|uniref:putative protein TPRXL n=1 Tax=Stylophora pistillata TaxID=50429 RepID=UPI000C03FF83|nr:putative protein TPRXL [Stylophora pistillata]